MRAGLPATSTELAADRARGRMRTMAVRGLLFILILGLLFVALRNAPLASIWLALRRLSASQILVILGIDLAIHMFMSLRWWLIISAEDKRVRFMPLVGARLAAFGVSYFTVGPQVGGEPFQVLYLRRQQGTSYVRATATVVLDKLLELLANFLFLLVGLTALIRAGILGPAGGITSLSLPLLAVLAAWPAVHLILLWKGQHPVSTAVAAVRAIPPDGRPARYVRAAENLAGQFCRRHPGSLLAAIGVSLVPCLAAVIEYSLITSFLGVALDTWQTVAGWSAGWLSFLVPVPGGLGALEASQVLALGRFGVPAATAIGLTLILRARDLVFGGAGLAFGARTLGLGKSIRDTSGVGIDVSARAEGGAVVSRGSTPIERKS